MRTWSLPCQLAHLSVLLTVLLCFAQPAHSQVIAVLDAGGEADGSGQVLSDLSTNGNDIGSISGVFSFTGPPDFTTNNGGGSWNASEFAFGPDSTETATWMFSGLPAGTTWEVFASWNNAPQGNLSENAPYSVQGNQVLVNQEAGAVFFQDLILNDGTADIDFASLGTALVGPDGSLTVTLEGTGPDTIESDLDFVIADSIAIRMLVQPLLGDVDRNGSVNFLDIAQFIELLSTQGFQAEADIDQNGVVNFLDIAPFIAILAAN